MSEIKIFWRDKEIGYLTDPVPDMWYCNYKWKHSETNDAIAFKTLVSNFNAGEIMKHPEKGTSIFIKYIDSNTIDNALVLTLENDDLFVRHIYEPAAVDWLLKNVH